MGSYFDRTILFVTSIILSFAVGRFVSSNSTEIEQLRKQLAQTRSELEQISNEGSSRSRGGSSQEKPPSFSSSGEFNPGASKLTKEEQELTEELFRRREEDEYILKYELPAARKASLRLRQKVVEETAKKNAPEYFRFFSELGLDAKTTSELQTHISTIQKASLELADAMTQSLVAKESFNQKLHAIMNDEQYSRYRSFEESKAAVREFNRLEEYSQKSNLTIDPAYTQTIQDIIQQTHAYSSKPYQGPFDNGVCLQLLLAKK